MFDPRLLTGFLPQVTPILGACAEHRPHHDQARGHEQNTRENLAGTGGLRESVKAHQSGTFQSKIVDQRHTSRSAPMGRAGGILAGYGSLMDSKIV